MKPFNYKTIYEHKGLAMLPTIIILSLVVLAIGTSMTISGFIESSMSKATIETQKSFYSADSGINDALLKIKLDETLGAENSEDLNFFAVGEEGPDINVSPGGVGITRIITSSVTAGKYKKTIKTTVTLDDEGNITGTAWEEVTE